MFKQRRLFAGRDKYAFAGGAIKTVVIGKIVGVYKRILFFFNYSSTHSTEIDEAKCMKLAPLVGSLVSLLSQNLAYLHLAFKASEICVTIREENE